MNPENPHGWDRVSKYTGGREAWDTYFDDLQITHGLAPTRRAEPLPAVDMYDRDGNLVSRGDTQEVAETAQPRGIRAFFANLFRR